MKDLHSEDWVLMQRRHKWKYCGQTARRNDQQWCTRLLDWRPRRGTGRQRSHPHLRWEDVITKFAGGNWCEEAQDEDLWGSLEELFCNVAGESF